jgi:uncharacterized protein YdeI (YjbR/CyaY-like superfamily)
MNDTILFPKNQQEWRQWLEENHQTKTSVWLGYHKVKSGIPSIRYDEAVDEALCFGWIDSTARPIDDISYKQYFCRRKPTSVWSRVNKAKVARFIEQGLMAEAGLASIEIAKQNGSWTILDDAENLILPEALQKALEEQPEAQAYFGALSRTNKRNLLSWLALAKREETLLKRIQDIVDNALEGQLPKPYRTNG